MTSNLIAFNSPHLDLCKNGSFFARACALRLLRLFSTSIAAKYECNMNNA